MKPKPNPELVDDDNPEWSEADFRRAIPFSGLPAPMQQKLLGKRHVVVESDGQMLVAVPLAADLVEKFLAEGDGWEARINAALADWLASRTPSSPVR